MRVTYYNPALHLYVVDEGIDSRPVVLANLEQFENDAYDTHDAVQRELYTLDPDHCCCITTQGTTYVAERRGVTIWFAQVLRFADHSHSPTYLAEALAAVRVYEEGCPK